MCKKKQFKYCPSKIDKCMVNYIENLNLALKESIIIKACCCGHNKYPPTIVIEKTDTLGVVNYDLISGVVIPRKKKFYKKDKKGYYYIPEVLNG